MTVKYNFDVVIIGAGLAGLYTALKINPKFKVAIITKETLDENNSFLAQGGIAACINNDDKFDLHIEDTWTAGSEMNNIQNLQQLVKSAPSNIEELVNLGVEFDRDETGTIRTTMEGGHSRRRVLHAGGDATGREIVKALGRELRKRENIILFEDVMVIDLINDDNKCMGVTALNGDKSIIILASATVLATGGIGEIYNNSTNSSVATGDGIAMAYRTGCKVDSMEFIQFHPTAFYSKDKGQKFLISEAVRGEGAVLRNKDGERFMKKYHKSFELAPRDIVSKSIYNELKETQSDFVYLDITHKNKEYLVKRFPTIYKKCLENNIDMSKDYIPVKPVQHYNIGGIRVDRYGRTKVDNLYACGECSNTGVHGANRLASNSLLECVVFGRKIAEDINNTVEDILDYKYDSTHINIDDNIKRTKTNLDIDDITSTIKNTMEAYAGIVRWEKGLLKAKKIIDDILNNLNDNYTYNKEYLEALNMATVAKLVIRDCLERKESVGCHFRIDDYHSKLRTISE